MAFCVVQYLLIEGTSGDLRMRFVKLNVSMFAEDYIFKPFCFLIASTLMKWVLAVTVAAVASTTFSYAVPYQPHPAPTTNSGKERNLGFISSIVDVLGDSPEHDNPTNETVTHRDNEAALGPMHFNNVTWISSHNAHANNFAAGDNILKKLSSNQEMSIYKQLKYIGVRGLMLDIECDISDDEIRMVHGVVDFGSLQDLIANEISPFLDEDPEAIITIDLETLGDRELLMQKLRILFAQELSFARRMFKISSEKWANHNQWPTIQEMRDADQRIIILSDSTIVQSEELGIMVRGDIVIENHWLNGLNDCTPRNKLWAPRRIAVANKKWTRLFTMNHFCCGTGMESLESVKPSNNGGGDNGWGVVYPRSQICTTANGHSIKPNYIAVDWCNIGDAFEVAEYLTFGGRLGFGQPCKTGLDCATGACSQKQRCHCQVCDDDPTWPTCSGCDVNELCLTTIEGVNECSSTTGILLNSVSNSGSTHLPDVSISSKLFWVSLLINRRL